MLWFHVQNLYLKLECKFLIDNKSSLSTTNIIDKLCRSDAASSKELYCVSYRKPNVTIQLFFTMRKSPKISCWKRYRFRFEQIRSRHSSDARSRGEGTKPVTRARLTTDEKYRNTGRPGTRAQKIIENLFEHLSEIARFPLRAF